MTNAEFKAKAIVAVKDLMTPECGPDYGMMDEHERREIRKRNRLLSEIAAMIWSLPLSEQNGVKDAEDL